MKQLKSVFNEVPIVIADVKQWPVLWLPVEFNEKNWADMMRVLNAFKDGLVTKSAQESDGEGR